MLELRFLEKEGLWETLVPGYSVGYRLLHADPWSALDWITQKVYDIRARGWVEVWDDGGLDATLHNSQLH